MRSLARRRATVVCALMALIFTAYSARLIYLQVTKHEEYTEIAARTHSITIEQPARRGMIRDRNNSILAANVPIRKVIIDGTHVNNVEKLAKLAAPYLGLPEARLADELAYEKDHEKKSKVLLRELDEEKALALQAEMDKQNLRGLYFYQNNIRIYPNGSMLSHVLGFLSRKEPTDEHLVGMEGIERSMEAELRGEDGFRRIERDRKGREIVIYRNQEKPPQHGHDVNLTIDMGLQAILEEELDTACAELTPNTAIGIIVDPKTGEILAMSSRPTFDVGKINAAKPEQMKNRAIIDTFEPGSTFKIVVASAALNERVIDENTMIFCENGRFAYGGAILRDHHGYGDMNIRGILMKSSNIGSAKLALRLGDERYYEYVRRFGFGEVTGVDLPGEVYGRVRTPGNWDKLTITRMPMGQGVTVTPLQIAMSMSVIANGGHLMRPHIIKDITDQDGNIIRSYPPEVVREVVPEAITRTVSDALVSVTGEGGTAKLADVPGYLVAGKTGTAQKVINGRYSETKYVTSFVGYMPAGDPRFVCLIMFDEPHVPNGGTAYGGTLAAPVFAKVATRAARYLNLTPSPEAPGPASLPIAMQTPRGAKKEVAQ